MEGNKKTTKKKTRYVASAKAKANPVFLIGRGFSIGGDVTVERPAPKLPKVFKAGTQAQLKKYYTDCEGKTLLVEKIEG